MITLNQKHRDLDRVAPSASDAQLASAPQLCHIISTSKSALPCARDQHGSVTNGVLSGQRPSGQAETLLQRADGEWGGRVLQRGAGERAADLGEGLSNGHLPGSGENPGMYPNIDEKAGDGVYCAGRPVVLSLTVIYGYVACFMEQREGCAVCASHG